jgi:hypothetical protein
MYPESIIIVENSFRNLQKEVNTFSEFFRYQLLYAEIDVLTYFLFVVFRYAYHLRRWALEGQAISSHVMSWELGAIPLHIIVHAAGMPDKVTLEMASNDYIADLRAEVAKWWEVMTIKRGQSAVSNFY